MEAFMNFMWVVAIFVVECGHYAPEDRIQHIEVKTVDNELNVILWDTKKWVRYVV